MPRRSTTARRLCSSRPRGPTSASIPWRASPVAAWPRWSRSASASPRSRPPTAPSSAAGIGWSDVGAVELNEAFAVQSLACLDAWQVDPAIVNTRGGAIAIGHPLGASGARVISTLAQVLVERRERWGVAAICIGVGQGLAVVLENVA